MEPQNALRSDKDNFANQLEGLIDSVRSESRSSGHKRSPAAENTPTKRIKTEHEPETATSYGQNIHPSRVGLVQPPISYYAIEESPNLSELTHTTQPDIITSNGPPQTWHTLTNTVRRQWDARKDDLDYEFLLDQRRREKVQNVDRYVPSNPLGSKQKPKQSKFPLERLPEDIMARIFGLLLASHEPITIDIGWLRSFVKGHARVPKAMQTVEHDGSTYAFPVPWNKLLSDVQLMQGDMHQFKNALYSRGLKTKSQRSPARGLSISLFRVSHTVHENATRVFYGQNTFRFPCSTTAWMSLEGFIATIGTRNAEKLQHIRVHAPMWHRGIQKDFVEGAILDLLSPASRMAVIKPPAHDRLLSAIHYCTNALLQARNLKSLTLDLENGMSADYWSGRYNNEKRLISVSEAEEHVERKAKAIAKLKEASDLLAVNQNKPVLTLHNPSRIAPVHAKEFHRRLPAVVAEAEKYGWQVHPRLR